MSKRHARVTDLELNEFDIGDSWVTLGKISPQRHVTGYCFFEGIQVNCINDGGVAIIVNDTLLVHPIHLMIISLTLSWPVKLDI